MTRRAVIIGALLVCGFCFVVPYNDVGLDNTYLTGNHFPVGVFFIFVVLTIGANALLKLVRRKWRFRRAELLLIWCMLIVASTVPSNGLMRYLFGTVTAPPYFARQEQVTWEETIWRDIPRDLVLSKELDDPVVEQFYRGSERGEIPWSQWVRPMTAWGIYVGLFYSTSIFMMSLLRRRWVESERLMFPLTALPLEISRGAGDERLLPGLFRNKLFWVGAVLVILFDLYKISPRLLGTGPGIRVMVPFKSAVQGTALEHAHIWDGTVMPFVIGLVFLVPARISFSLWFWWLFARFQMQMSHAMGLPAQHDYSPFMKWQQMGAMVMLSGVLIWSARHHLFGVARKALGLASEVDDSGEPISYRLSFWGMILSFAGLVGWSVYYGVSPWAAVAVLGLMFAMCLALTRLLAQGGLFFVQATWSPVNVVHGLSGGLALGAQALVVTQMQHCMLTGDSREILSGHAANALKIFGEAGERMRGFLPLMSLALVLALLFGGWGSLRMYYSRGALNVVNDWGVQKRNRATFRDAERQAMRPQETARPHPAGAALGAGLMGGCMVARHFFHWWPLHPLGLVVASGWVMASMWFSVFLAWLAKILLMRLGGARVVRQGRQFFIGVVAAETFFIACVTGTGLLLGIRFHHLLFMPA